jgi:hypothetical protein
MSSAPFSLDMLARRVFLRGLAGSLGSIAVSHLLRQENAAKCDEPIGPPAPTPYSACSSMADPVRWIYLIRNRC